MQKTILITGSTDGIGKLAALKFAKAGHEVYIHGRNAAKLESVILEIKKASNNEKINGFVADFSDLEAVKNMAKKVNEQLSKIDVLINNAGVFKSPNMLNKDGLDLRYVVNYFAPFVLTNELIPLLNQSVKPRILNLSSAAQAPVDFDVLTGKTTQGDRATYAQSKLALTMWSFYLAETLPNINVIAVNPGSLLNTNMVKEAFGQFWDSADKGANILYDLAINPTHENRSGQYFDNDNARFAKAHPEAYNEAKIEEMIRITKEMIA